MNAVLQMSALPDDVEIAVEFQIPLTSKRARSDKSLIGISSNSLHVTADRIIRNTYKTLLTRGQKGCYIYCEDKALFDYLAQWIPVATLSADDEHY